MPILTILAGPNGAGKTRTTDFLLASNLFSVSPVDLDLLRLEAIDQCPQSIYSINVDKELDRLFRSYCEDAIRINEDFCFECNLRKDQLKYVQLFEEAGYDLHLIYLTLETIEQSRERVNHRVKTENGRNVDDESIRTNFIEGLQNLDLCFDEFNYVFVFDNSLDDQDFKMQLFIDKSAEPIVLFASKFPSKNLKQYLPRITALKKRIKQPNPMAFY